MPGNPSQAPHATWAMPAVLAIVAAVYAPSLLSGFNADDYLILAKIKSVGGLGDPLAYFQFAFYDYFRPVAFLSHALDWQLWGVNPVGFHVTNLILHLANTWLVFHVGRGLVGGRSATLGALLFGLHPASHEAVYWIAARFDLLATFFTLTAVMCLARDGRSWRAAGLTAFGLALLSKESAISLLVIAPARDVFIGRLDWRLTLRRLLPLVGIVVAYSLARHVGADLDAVGGSRRLPKLFMTAGALAALLMLARSPERQPIGSRFYDAAERARWPLAIAVVLVPGAVLLWPPAFPWLAEKLGFVAYVSFYAISPVVFPAPPHDWFLPDTALRAMPHLLVLGAIVWLALKVLRLYAGRVDEAAFLSVFAVASLVPVSSMTGGLRYLYLATAGLAPLAALLLHRLAPSRAVVPAAIIVLLAASVQQVLHAGRAWRAAAVTTREGIALMSAATRPCGTKDVVLLTAPAGIGGVYGNLSWDAFDVLTGCAPRSLTALLRVVRTDARVDTRSVGADIVDLRVPDYRGNIVASEDLRNFTRVIEPGETTTMQTAAGRLETFAEGTTQVFRWTLTGEFPRAARFYYSEGRVRQ